MSELREVIVRTEFLANLWQCVGRYKGVSFPTVMKEKRKNTPKGYFHYLPKFLVIQPSMIKNWMRGAIR